MRPIGSLREVLLQINQSEMATMITYGVIDKEQLLYNAQVYFLKQSNQFEPANKNCFFHTKIKVFNQKLKLLCI